MLRNTIYYRVKPFIPAAIRTAVRRTVAARLRTRVGAVWPIMPGSENPPAAWTGWPEKKKFAFVLTHDVEGQSGLDKCQQLLRIEQEFGFRSSFNFIPEGRYRVSEKLRLEMARAGVEVGVHDLKHDGSLYRSRRDFGQSAKRINDYLKRWNATGFRSGFMLHNLDWLHDLEISYDMSTFDTDPFEPQPDGRHTIFPFWVERPSRRSGSADATVGNGSTTPGYVELPYTLPQDSTLFLLLGENTADIWTRKLDWIAEHGGMALVNIHPDYIDFSKDGTDRNCYPAARVADLLRHVQHKYGGQFWNPLPKELAGWYESTRRSSKRSNAGPIQGATPRADLRGKKAAVLLYSYYPADPRPRRAAEALVECGMAVDLICLRQSTSEKRRDEVNGVNILRLPWRKTRDSKIGYIRQYATFIGSCFSILTLRSVGKRYDVVHVHNMPDVLVFAALVPKLFGARIILDLHDPMPELMMSIYELSAGNGLVRWLKRLEKFSIAFADLVLTPNIAFRELFLSRGCPPEKIEIVMNSPQEEIFDPMCPAPEDDSISMATSPSEARNGSRDGTQPAAQTFRIMYHGSLVHRHGLDVAVRAVALAQRTIPGIHLDIFGDQTEYLGSVLSLAKELGLEKVVNYHGPKPQGEIARRIAQSDLGIIPNRFSPFTDLNFPTRIFEYLAMGRPVIAPDTRGIKDYFDDTSLIFFLPDSENSLAEKVIWVWQHPEETEEIVQRGQAIYQRHLWNQQKTTLQNRAQALCA